MSHFDVFQADEQAVWDTLAAVRARFPDADVRVTVEDGIIVISGQAADEEMRREIIEAFRAVNPGLAPVVAGALGTKDAAPKPAGPPRRPSRLHFSSRFTELSRRTTQRIYRVQQGDTLESIAVRFYSDPKAVRLLCYANGDQLESSRHVRAGTMLTVPETLYHPVAPGETLQALAQRYYQDSNMASALKRANPEMAEAGDGLTPGSTVRVPINP